MQHIILTILFSYFRLWTIRQDNKIVIERQPVSVFLPYGVLVEVAGLSHHQSPFVGLGVSRPVIVVRLVFIGKTLVLRTETIAELFVQINAEAVSADIGIQGHQI